MRRDSSVKQVGNIFLECLPVYPLCHRHRHALLALQPIAITDSTNATSAEREEDGFFDR